MRYKSPLRWAGGKSRHTKHLIPLMPTGVKEFRDVFCGAGWVSLAAKKANIAERYWLNDKFMPLWNFWLVVIHEAQPLVDQVFFALEQSDEKLREQVVAARARLAEGKHYGRIPMALDFFLVNRCSFSGATLSGGLKKNLRDRFKPSSIDRILDCYVIMKDFGITGVDFQGPVEKGGDRVFLFCDPPYVDAERLYGKNGDLHKGFNHLKLARLLRESHHLWMLTYDDNPIIRDIYKGFDIRELDVTNSMDNCGKSGKPKQVTELVITNY